MLLLFMHITTFVILIPIGVGLWRYSSLEREMKWLLLMLIPVAANQFFSIWWSNYVEKNNLPFYYAYILMELLFVAKIYSLYLKRSRFRWLIPVLTICFSVLFIGKFLCDVDALWEYSTHLRTIEGIIVLFFASAYFLHVYRRQEIMYLQKTSGFWIGGGLILYFTSNLLLFAFSELVFAQESGVFQSIWSIHAILTILLYISFTIALLCKKTETIS